MSSLNARTPLEQEVYDRLKRAEFLVSEGPVKDFCEGMKENFGAKVIYADVELRRIIANGLPPVKGENKFAYFSRIGRPNNIITYFGSTDGNYWLTKSPIDPLTNEPEDPTSKNPFLKFLQFYLKKGPLSSEAIAFGYMYQLFELYGKDIATNHNLRMNWKPETVLGFKMVGPEQHKRIFDLWTALAKQTINTEPSQEGSKLDDPEIMKIYRENIKYFLVTSDERLAIKNLVSELLDKLPKDLITVEAKNEETAAPKTESPEPAPFFQKRPASGKPLIFGKYELVGLSESMAQKIDSIVVSMMQKQDLNLFKSEFYEQLDKMNSSERFELLNWLDTLLPVFGATTAHVFQGFEIKYRNIVTVMNYIKNFKKEP